MIALEGVSHRFRSDGPLVLDHVSLRVGAGEVVAIVGPSGCGKSTLLNIVAGLVVPAEGTAEVDGRCGYVFQDPRLFPWRRVLGNVAFALEQRGLPAAAGRQRARETLALVGLADDEDLYPHELSGGMAQRAGLARALAIDPDVLLLDEPLAALDALTRQYLQEELGDLFRRPGSATLLVTHDIDEAVLLADRVVVLSSRPASVTADFPTAGQTGLHDHIYELLRPEIVG